MPEKKITKKTKKAVRSVKVEKKVKVAKTSDISLEKLLEAGAHFGHQARRWNPKMGEYLFGVQDGVHIFDLVKTKEKLEEALNALLEAKKAGKTILFIGTKKQAQEKTKEVAIALNSPYVNQRFLGGTFTNFNEIKKSIRKLSEMKENMKKGVYAEFTKKEKLLLAKEIADLEKHFGGVSSLDKLPDMVFIIDTHKEHGAVLESKKMGITVVGIVDSNSDPNIDYPIPMNDDASKAVDYVLDLIKEKTFLNVKNNS